jgi:hypothetical protein
MRTNHNNTILSNHPFQIPTFVKRIIMKTAFVFSILLVTIFLQKFQAQVNASDTTTYVVTKTNNVEYIGKILSDDGREVLMETKELGKIYIPKSDIKSIKPLDYSKITKLGDYRELGPFTTRYQFTTNSFPIVKGENYTTINLYGPEVHFAVSNRFSVGVIASWIASPMILALKYTIPTQNEKLNFGFGTLFGTSGYLNQGRGFGGLHWGMVTYGDRLNNITFSAGFSYIKLGMDNFYGLYKPGIYPAIQDNWNPNNYYFDYNLPYDRKSADPRVVAPILGLAGIVSVGKRASFILDAMLLFGQSKRPIYTQEVNYVYNSTTSQPLHTDVKPAVLEGYNTNKSTNLVLMPGMRFQKSEKEAFQVSLAGIIGKSDGNSYSFPIPMLTWFFKF